MPSVPCRACPLRRFPLFHPFTAEEAAFMERFKQGELTVGPGATVLAEGSSAPQVFTVLDGLGVRATTIENGQRQVISFLFPGDFIGLQAGLMGEMKHAVEAVTPMTLCVFDRSRLWQLFRSNPDRAYDLTWIAAVEEHFLGETIASLGQRDAAARIAWALLRMWQRLRAVGLGRAVEGGEAVPLPFRQQDLADALGLSLVHTNKTLARLRTGGLASWSGGRLVVREPARLAAIGQTSLEPPPRRPLM